MADPSGPIPHWRTDERPRERLLRRGPEPLTDADLLALLLGSGTAQNTAVAVGRRLLATHHSLRGLARRDVRELMEIPGVGPARAARLAAAFEAGRRMAAEREGPRLRVRGPADVAAVYAPSMRDLDREVFTVVLLNTAGDIIGDAVASSGGLASSIVEPRAVFRRAILEAAAAVICVHNHPSGNPEPSAEDRAVTRQLVDAGRVMGIPVRDHIIIAGDGWTSLAERGML